MQITQCLHAAVLISNLEQAEHFYGDVLGLSKVERMREAHATQTLKYPGAWYQLGEFQFHLIVAPDFMPSIQNPEKWGRNPHIAFAVTDLEAAKNHLVAHNCQIQMSASGRAALFTQDPDGNIVELSERGQGSGIRG